MTQVHAHKMVAHIAREMAQAVYEECAKDNAWYAKYRNRAAFVRGLAPELIGQARAVLTEMLMRPGVSDYEKDTIMDALAADQTVPRGKGAVH